MSDMVEVIHDRLIQQQVDSIRFVQPEPSGNHSIRIGDYLVRGQHNMWVVLDAAGVSSALLQECFELARRDRRLGFVKKLPQSAALGAALSDAFTHCLSGNVDDFSSELATLIDLFITLIDGLIDEVPEVFEATREQLQCLLSLKSPLWEEVAYLPDFDEIEHPLNQVVMHLLLEAVNRMKRTPSWTHDPQLRSTIIHAIEQAFEAELRSQRFQKISQPTDLNMVESTLLRKSENAVWVTALASTCNYAMPNWFVLDEFESASRALGRYLGWIDDLADLFVDILDMRWNSVLLRINSSTSFATLNAPPSWPFAVATGISYDHISEDIVLTGRAYYEDVIVKLDRSGLRLPKMMEVVDDLTLSWLKCR